jgi:hypothetical protein
VRSHVVANVTAKLLREVLVSQVEADSHLMTDGAGQYRHAAFGKPFISHETVDHGIGEYVRGEAHTNTIEGYFSVLKRAIYGTYHHVSPKHLKRYLGEADFRYNERDALGVDDVMRTRKAVAGVVGKRVTYQQPHGRSGRAQG